MAIHDDGEVAPAAGTMEISDVADPELVDARGLEPEDEVRDLGKEAAYAAGTAIELPLISRTLPLA
jgi:hypothetical protein